MHVSQGFVRQTDGWLAITDDYVSEIDVNTVLLVRGTADGIVDLTGKTITNTGVTVGDETSGPFDGDSVSRALVLNGSSYIAYPSLGLTGSITIDGWFQTSIPAAEQRNTYSDTTDIVYALLRCAGSKFAISSYATNLTGTQIITANTYYHVCAIWDYEKQLDDDNAKLYLYINGLLQAEGAIGQRGISSPPYGRYVGAARDATARWYGKIAEFRVSNIARDPAEFPPTKPYGT